MQGCIYFQALQLHFFQLVPMDKYFQTTTCLQTFLACSVCHNHNPVLSSFMTYHRVCNKSNTTGATCGSGTAYPSEAPEFTPSFSGLRVARSLVFCVVFCRSLFALLSFFFWSLCCLSFNLQLLITLLISSNFSYILNKQNKNK